MKYSHNSSPPDVKGTHLGKVDAKALKSEYTNFPMDQKMLSGQGGLPKLNQQEQMAKDANIEKHPVFFTKE